MIGIIVLVILIFGLLVFIHEFGHFWAAKRAGVAVQEFGFGFPPRVFGRRVGGTIYSINLIPLGGFVKLKGENLTDRAKDSFGGASFAHKTKILLAGVTMNALLAYLILVWLALTGLPPVIQDQFSFGSYTYAQPRQVMAVIVREGSPAAKSGIERGDVMLEGNGQRFNKETDLIDFTKANAGKTVSLKIIHDGQEKNIETTLSPPEKKSGYLGVTPFQTYKLKYDLLHAPVVAAGILWQLTVGTLLAFGGLLSGLFIHGQVSENVAGPVGIVSLLNNIVDLGLAYVLVFVASISLSLAVINALPLPALDGGRLALVVVQKVTKRQLSQKLEATVHILGFALLILLMIVVTYFDIKRLG